MNQRTNLFLLFKVHITKRPIPEKCVDLSFTEKKINAKSSAVLYINWSPKICVTWWDILQLTDNNQNKYEVTLIMRSKDPPQKYLKSRIPKTIMINGIEVPQPKKLLTFKKEYLPGQKFIQTRQKRPRGDSYLEELDKEKKLEESIKEKVKLKRPRKDTFSFNSKFFNITTNRRRFLFKSRNSQRRSFFDRVFNWESFKERVFDKESSRSEYDLDETIKAQDIECETTGNRKERKFLAQYETFRNGILRKESFQDRFIENLQERDLWDESFIISSKYDDFVHEDAETDINCNVKISPEKIHLPMMISSTPKLSYKCFCRHIDENVEEIEEKHGDNNNDDYDDSNNTLSETVICNVPEEICQLSSNEISCESLKKEMTNDSGTSSRLEKVKKTSKHVKKLVKIIRNSSIFFLSNNRNESLKSNYSDSLSVSITEDPFFSEALDESWMSGQEQEFKKWLNALMTPPEDFTETTNVDIGKIWQSVRTMDDVLAESKESVSARYHTDMRLDTLRKAALKMFREHEVTGSIAGAIKCIENRKVEIKKDKSPHLDIGLQKEIIQLFLSYNPLWLRIGLETVYGERIPLKSNNDLVGMTRFLLSRFFSDPTISREHTHSLGLRLASFRPTINDFILKTFLKLVCFLDYAKMNKLIGDDPCLFRKKSPHKESRMILIKFSSLVLGGIGDIIKVLRIAGYVVKHKQSYLEEFDYAVHDMNTDLRDGVRLCRVMELITGKKDLTRKCSVPAISKIQKVHNVRIALEALQEAGYLITGDIDARSIADGNRNKTLSLLWQIVYKFQAPRFLKAALLLQNWWRRKLWGIRFKKFLEEKKANEGTKVVEDNSRIRNVAAITIQKWWRAKREMRNCDEKVRKRKEAIMFLQKYWETRRLMSRQREQIIRVKKAFSLVQDKLKGRKTDESEKQEKAAGIIQKNWRAWKLRETEERKMFLKKRESAIVIQRFWKQSRNAAEIRQNFLKIKSASLVIQKRYRAIIQGRETRQQFEKLTNSVLKIQRFWRMILLKKQQAAIIIQRKWRAWKLMRIEREKFLLLKNATRTIEEFWIRVKLSEREEFFKKWESAILIQRFWKRSQNALKIRREFLMIKSATIVIQTKWREIILVRETRKKFENIRDSVVKIQRFWRRILWKRHVEKLICQKKMENSNIEFSTKTLALRLRESIDIFKMTSDLGRLSMCLASLGKLFYFKIIFPFY